MKAIQLTIAEPCHENWNQMLPEEQGKFCLSCQKTVVDFSVMSDRQVLEYFEKDTGNTCGRFYGDQLNRPVSITKDKRTNRWKYILQLLIPAVFAMHKAKAQKVLMMGKVAAPVVQPKVPKQDIREFGSAQAATTKTVLKGSIVDDKGKPVPYASIRSMDNQHATMADSSGNFTLRMKDMQPIVISSVGYLERKVATNEFMRMTGFKIGVENGYTVMSGMLMELQPLADGAEVVVTGCGITRRSTYITGGYTRISVNELQDVKVSTKTQTKKVLVKEVSVKIYPNPIMVGHDFKVQFQVVKRGHYLLEIVDASGKLIQAKPITMNNLEQTETIEGYRLIQAGVYVVNLKDAKNKNIFTGKLLVQ